LEHLPNLYSVTLELKISAVTIRHQLSFSFDQGVMAAFKKRENMYFPVACQQSLGPVV
jgi:hypothetical protein